MLNVRKLRLFELPWLRREAGSCKFDFFARQARKICGGRMKRLFLIAVLAYA